MTQSRARGNPGGRIERAWGGRPCPPKRTGSGTAFVSVRGWNRTPVLFQSGGQGRPPHALRASPARIVRQYEGCLETTGSDAAVCPRGAGVPARQNVRVKGTAFVSVRGWSRTPLLFQSGGQGRPPHALRASPAPDRSAVRRMFGNDKIRRGGLPPWGGGPCPPNVRVKGTSFPFRSGMEADSVAF